MAKVNTHVRRGPTFPLCGHRRSKKNTWGRQGGSYYWTESCLTCIRTRSLKKLVHELESARFQLGRRLQLLELFPERTQASTTKRIKKRVDDAQHALNAWIEKQPWKTNLGGYG